MIDTVTASLGQEASAVPAHSLSMAVGFGLGRRLWPVFAEVVRIFVERFFASLAKSPGWRPAGSHRQRPVALMLHAVSAIPSLIPARCRGAIRLWLAACLPQCWSEP